MSTGIAQDILAEVDNMSEDALREEFDKLCATKARQAQYNKDHRTNMTDEQKEKQKARNKIRYDKQKAIMERAKNLGLVA